MDTIFGPPVSINIEINEQTYNAMVKQIRKLRWMGMEDEATRLQMGLSAKATAHSADSVIAGPMDTD
jgi:hypothetical protein